MTKIENFFTSESAQRKIEQLRDQGKCFSVEEITDYGSVCEGLTLSYIQIIWDE